MKNLRRFMNKVEFQEDGCWRWTGGLSGNGRGGGYGRFWAYGTMIAAHRYIYELMFGKLPKKKQVDHTCEFRACVNPAHLEACSNKENCQRRDKRNGR